MNRDYPYVSDDPFALPPAYAYAPFAGAAFLDAWSQQRETLRRRLPAADTGGGPATLADALRGLLPAPLVADGPDPLTLLDRLVQRFEVSKRIYSVYDENLRPAPGADHRQPERYLRFAGLLTLAYPATGRLQYLNALLKCLDLLAGCAASLDAGGGARLAALIGQERRFVAALAADHGITLP